MSTVTESIDYRWRRPVTDAEMVALVAGHGGKPDPGWWDQVRPHSLGWMTARLPDGTLIGFVNVAWDDGDQPSLLNRRAPGHAERRASAAASVREGRDHANAAGCEWLHVD